MALCKNGVEPLLPYDATRLLPPDENAAREFEAKIPMDPQYDGKVSRFEVQKAKKEMPTQSECSVEGPLSTPVTPGKGLISPSTASPASPNTTPPVMPQPTAPETTPRTLGRGNTSLSLYFGNCEDRFSAGLAEIRCGLLMPLLS